MPATHPPARPAAPPPSLRPTTATPALSGPLPPFPGPIRPHWQAKARANGFAIIGRVRDRYHLRLRCLACGGELVSKLYVVTNSRPLCPHCLARRRAATARQAGVTFLGQDPERTAYGVYRAACGHILRRQFEIVERAARGATGLRCATCLVRREEAEARRHGWQRLGPDTGRRGHHRLYRHACGHRQSIAPVNMAWGQCDCAGCGQSWAARPSLIYLFDIRMPAGGGSAARHYLKLGYSSHPEKRHRHQLGLPGGAEVTVLRILPMPTGHAACAAEKAAHARLVRAHPDAVVPARELAGRMTVRTEIYRPRLRAILEAEIDRIAATVVSTQAQGDTIAALTPGTGGRAPSPSHRSRPAIVPGGQP